MSDKPAALLTKTQRDRIDDNFQSVEGAKRRRDQQRTRRRVAAGIDDFAYLVEYPDEQLKAAFDSYDDERLVRALADMRVVSERVRLLHDVERGEILRRARARMQAAECSDRTVSELEFQTHDEIRDAVTTELETKHEPDDWKRRSELALKTGSLLALPGVSLIPLPYGAVPLTIDGALVFVVLFFCWSAAGVWVRSSPTPERQR
ncbi:MAG: hypothetical protein J07HQX50_01544 [Haloquadratum sp. J07HQX50]|nr:MAG: hypothetical protein J07HQX50_01544 [Haloquadratum sp. J07HQX50]